METSDIKILRIFSILLLLSLLTIFLFQNFDKGEKINYNGRVCIFLNDKLIECKNNLLTNVGKNLIRASLQGLNVNISKIALATNTVPMSPGDTSLQGEITDCNLSAAIGNIVNSSIAGVWNISYQWTCTCDNKIVNATGLYNATGANTLFAETTFANTILNTNDKINVTWIINITE